MPDLPSSGRAAEPCRCGHGAATHVGGIAGGQCLACSCPVYLASAPGDEFGLRDDIRYLLDQLAAAREAAEKFDEEERHTRAALHFAQRDLATLRSENAHWQDMALSFGELNDMNSKALLRAIEDAEKAEADLTALRAQRAGDAPTERDALVPLARLGLAALDACHEGGDYDGGDIQDEAEKVGVVKPEPANAPCGDNCLCAEYGSDICYRDTPATTAARAIIAALPPGGGGTT